MGRPSERNRQVVRQWEILLMLEGQPRTLNELAASVGDGGVTTRTIRRDLDALQSAGFPIFNDVDDEDACRWQLLTKNVTPRRAA